MKIIVIGAGGAVGSAVCSELGGRHELVTVGRSSGDIQADITDGDSIDAMYREAGKVDAVVCASGHAHFGPLEEMTGEQFMVGLTDKVMGQVNVVLRGLVHVNDGGSFTLTTGVVGREPIRKGANAATANGALEAFAAAAAVEMPRGIRINAVNPELLDVSAERLGAMFPGHEPVSSHRVGLAYAKCVEGAGTGRVIIAD
jgi:NAD(P)-dependent dehydrogenase (short-subunit alcohol dehydrogenase family)